MKLSGLAAFFLYDELQRCGVTDGRAFCLRWCDGGFLLDIDYPAVGDRLAVFRGEHRNKAGYQLEVDWPRDSDRVAVFRQKVVLALDKRLNEELADTRLDARLNCDEDSVTMMLCREVHWRPPAESD